ncbi:MAG: ribonuclease H-like domain-containing protein [Myxococcales bacterium]|nr:ribonuclease H-like domain-containing protein [Myxococcales bacterium]
MSKLRSRLDRLLPGSASSAAEPSASFETSPPASTRQPVSAPDLAPPDVGHPAQRRRTSTASELAEAGTSPRLRSLREQLDELVDRRRAVRAEPMRADPSDRPTAERALDGLDKRSLRFEPSLDQRVVERVDPEAALCAIGGRMVPTEFGGVMLIERRYRLGYSHGHSTLESATGDADWARWTQNPRFDDFSLQNAVFFDLETTGLSHGAGNLAFLVGVGRFVGDEFRLYQYFLDDISREQAMLALLGEHFEACRHLVTFNGKSFDAHVLHNRQILHRMQPTLALTARIDEHLDLLHLSRRLFRGAYADTRLQTLEREELGVVRVDDVPSALIPSFYFHFLQSGEIGPLLGVIEHNRLDVLSMVTLLGRLRQMLAFPEQSLGSKTRLNLARWFAKIGDPTSAFAIARGTLDVDRRPPCELFAIGYEACRRVATVDDEAIERWFTAWREIYPEDRALHEAMAMHYERRVKNFAKALRHARVAASLALGYRCRVSDALKRRIDRLERRLAP